MERQPDAGADYRVQLDMLAKAIPTVIDRRPSIGLAIVLDWHRTRWIFAADAGPARTGAGHTYVCLRPDDSSVRP